MIHLVLLSGGSGSRLWPLSNSARSKQFLKVLRDSDGKHVSMVQRVFEQIAAIPCEQSEIDITIATCANQESSIRAQLEGSYELVLEPERRDTAPAIFLACAHLAYAQNASVDDTVVVMPIDSYADQSFYDKVLDLDIVAFNSGGIVLLGVEPTHPSEKFGYIIPKSRELENDAWCVEEFKEKPCKDIAEAYIEQGALWNCGVFGFRLGYVLDILSQYNESKSFEDIRKNYSALPKISFDYEVVEKATNVFVVPYSGTWKDLGTWNSLTEEMQDWSQGRVSVSDVENVHVINETGLPVVVSGLRDAVVVCTHDGILACTKEASDGIKNQVEAVGETRPMYEKRRWGEYRVLDSRVYDNGKNALTKELVIATGKQLSYQRHAYRSEVWTVVKGEGEVVLDGHVTPVVPGTVLDIRPMQMHAVRSINDLHIIEVQLGSPLIEEDIERFGNYWDD